MIFSSPLFIFMFLPVTLLLYFILPKEFNNIVLLFISLLFYAWGDSIYIILMLLVIIANFFFGIVISNNIKYKKFFLYFAIIFDLFILFYFKYANFFIDIANNIFNFNIGKRDPHLPLGISFYIFQILSYIIDVYRKKVKVQKNIFNLALYISFFPQLIAGPIVRYENIEKQIAKRDNSVEKFHDGVVKFSIGFIKKVLIADQLALIGSNQYWITFPSIYTYWIGAIAYTLQIYFDFSGYSDMATGLGKMFGFDFIENFNYPYISKSIREFWKRWHISLGSWFRDYVYIPLGGNKKGELRTYINLLIVFFLTGLWHGASFNFILWGLYYALFIIAERILHNKLIYIPNILKHFYTLFIVLFGWVIFKADTVEAAMTYIKNMFILSGNDFDNFLFNMNNQYWFF